MTEYKDPTAVTSEAGVVWFTSFISPEGFEESITIRSTKPEFLWLERRNVLNRLRENECTPVVKTYGYKKQTLSQSVEVNMECPIHHKPFRDGNYGKYCATKLDDGTWCKEKPKKQ